MEGPKDALRYCYFSLSLVGIWPEKKSSRFHAFMSIFALTWAFMSNFFFVILPQLSMLYYVGNDLDLIVNICSTSLIPCCTSVVKIFVLSLNAEEMSLLLENMYADFTNSRTARERSTMEASFRIGRRLSTACLSVAILTTKGYFVLRLYFLYHNSIVTGQRDLFFVSYFPFDTSISPIFEIVWILQSFGSLTASCTIYGTEILFAILVMHLCSQLTILQNELAELSTTDTEKKVERFSWVIKRHNKLNRYAETIEDSFNKMFIAQILGTAILFCLQGYRSISIVTDKTYERPVFQLMFMAMYICYMSIDMFIYCYIAEKLLIKSTDLADATYDCKWYNLSPKDVQNLIFIIRRSQHPLEITVGKFCILSLNLFAAIGKTSLGYLSMLLAVKERTITPLQLDELLPIMVLSNGFYIYFIILVQRFCGSVTVVTESLSGPRNALRYSYLCLSLVGIWPEKKSSRFHAFVSNVALTCALMFNFFFIILPQSVKLYYAGNDLDLIVDIFCTAVIPCSIGVVKMSVLYFNSKVMRSLLEDMFANFKNSQTDRERVTMEASFRSGRRVGLACLGLAFLTTNGFFVLRLYLLYQNSLVTGRRDLFFEAHFPFDISVSPNFEIVWALQSFGSLTASSANCGTDSFFAILVLHLCGQLTVLRNELAEFSAIDPEKKRQHFFWAIKKHNELNRYAKTIENTFNKMFIVQILGSAFLFCVQGYQLISIVTDKNYELPVFQLMFMVMYISYMSIDMFIYCYIAEKLRIKSIDLSDASYDCKWYKFNPRDVQNLIFIMRRAQHPLQITAGKFCTLSLNLFATIGKTSLGYLSMLLAVKERTNT